MRELEIPVNADDGCPVDDNVRACLRGMAQRGARLITDGPGATPRIERDGREPMGLALDLALVEALDARSWLTRIDVCVFILAPAGRAIVRAIKAAPAPQSGIGGVASALPGRTTADPQSPLAWARQHRNRHGDPYLSQEAYDAGERLRADFHRSGLMPRTTFDWDAISRSKDELRGVHAHKGRSGGGAGAAAERVRKAIAAVPPEMAGLVYDVCCFEHGVEETGRRHGMPQRSGHFMLSIALNALARHYGILPAPDNSQAARHMRPRHWGMPGYKPSIDAAPIPDTR